MVAYQALHSVAFYFYLAPLTRINLAGTVFLLRSYKLRFYMLSLHLKNTSKINPFYYFVIIVDARVTIKGFCFVVAVNRVKQNGLMIVPEIFTRGLNHLEDTQLSRHFRFYGTWMRHVLNILAPLLLPRPTSQ